jgi:hypothetical protein
MARRLSKARSHRNQVTRTPAATNVTGCRLKITLPTPRQNCRACRRTIEPEQDARRTGEADRVHDLCPPSPADREQTTNTGPLPG